MHIPTRFLLAASSMEQLRTPVWAPAPRGLCEDLLFSSTSPPWCRGGPRLGVSPTGVKKEVLLGSQGNLAGSLRVSLTEQMLGSLGRADSEEPCKCLFPTTDLPWLQREGLGFARHWNPWTPPPACLFILRLPARMVCLFILLAFFSFLPLLLLSLFPFVFSSFFYSFFFFIMSCAALLGKAL